MTIQCEVLHYLYYLLLLWLEFHGNQDIWHKDYTWKQTRSEDIILVLKYERKKRQEIIHWWADNVNTVLTTTMKMWTRCILLQIGCRYGVL